MKAILGAIIGLVGLGIVIFSLTGSRLSPSAVGDKPPAAARVAETPTPAGPPVVPNKANLPVNPPAALTDETAMSVRPITITNGIKHSVPLEEIIGGGPAKDGIPSIDKPKFWTVAEANKIYKEEEPGLAFSLNGINRFYPYQILVWHEIVNDTFAGQRVLITYCPLCFSGIVFDPVVGGERVAFGTSGKLWQSNLVMYDRKTQSYWSQILGEAIKGEMTGVKLAVLPSDITRFGLWKAQYPNGQVLSRDTGAARVYGSDPYGDYYTTPGTYFPVKHRDDRLADKEFILGLVADGQAKAYWPPAIKAKGEITDMFAGKTIVARYEPELDVTRLYKKNTDGTLKRLTPLVSFWFSWAAAYPTTELYK